MLDRLNFREAMSRLTGAVTVIATNGPAGLGGFTATAVCSITDDPPMLLACMNRNSRQHGVFNSNGVLCVNVLTAEQEQISRVLRVLPRWKSAFRLAGGRCWRPGRPLSKTRW